MPGLRTLSARPRSRASARWAATPFWGCFPVVPGDVYRALAAPNGYLSNGTFLANLGPISLDTGDRDMRFVVDDLAFGALSCATRESREER